MNEKLLLEIANNSILEYLSNKTIINKESLIKKYSFLNEKKATFVTLTINKRLRGCMGSLTARRTLLEDIILNSKNAAFKDPRFLPLKKEELENIKIELSILSTPIFLNYKDEFDLKNKIKKNIDGVIIEYMGNSATFLPQVWEQLNNFELFFKHLALKAGLNENILKKHPNIFIYKVKKITK